MEKLNKIEELNQMLKSGLITQDEYKSLLKETLSEEKINKVETEKTKSGKTYYTWVIVYLVINLGFHIVPSRFMVFPKGSLSFSNTFIFESDINRLISRYNNASEMEKVIILQDPLINKLFEKRILNEQNETYEPLESKK